MLSRLAVALLLALPLAACGRTFAPEKLVLVVGGDKPQERLELTLSVPKGWNYIKHGDAMIGDGLDGYVEAADPAEPSRQLLQVRGWFCGGAVTGCDAASFDASWSWQFGKKDADTDIAPVAPGVRMASKRRKDELPTVWVQHLVAGSPPMIVECSATVSAGEVPSDLVEACKGLALGARTPTFTDAMAAAEQAKLAACPGTSGVEYTAKERDVLVPVFGPATRLVIKPSFNTVGIGLLTNPGGVNPFDVGHPKLKDGETAVWLSILGARGGDLVSGTYPIVGGDARVARSLVLAIGGKDDDNLALTSDTALGSVEVIARTRDRICGRFSWESSKRKVTGTFDGPLAWP
ncbi:MAG: hypothetical protein U1F43_01390 [Myxococcota bacterium]